MGRGQKRPQRGRRGRCCPLPRPRASARVNQKPGQELSRWDSTGVFCPQGTLAIFWGLCGGHDGGAPGLGGRRPGIPLIAPEDDRAPPSLTLQEVRTEPRSPRHPMGEGEARTLSEPSDRETVPHTPHRAREGAACVAGQEGPVASVRRFHGWLLEVQVHRRKWGGGGTLAKVTLHLPGDSSALRAVAGRDAIFIFKVQTTIPEPPPTCRVTLQKWLCLSAPLCPRL